MEGQCGPLIYCLMLDCSTSPGALAPRGLPPPSTLFSTILPALNFAILGPFKSWPFCSTCVRARLTADGKLVTCLFSQIGHDLKGLLRSGSTDEEILNLMAGVWKKRADRYSDERLEAMQSSTGYDPKRHKKIEMITLGG